MSRELDRNTIAIVLGAAFIARATFVICGFDVKCFQEKGLVRILEEYLNLQRKIRK
jgi:hypothetical protein